MNGSFEPRIAAALLAATLVAGCATTEDTTGRLLVAPGGYEFYSCQQLAERVASLKVRRTELEHLMAKSERDAAGTVMSTFGYRPEYLQVRGQIQDVERTARGKQCDLSAVPAKAKATQPAPPRVAPAGPGPVKPR